MRKQVTKEQASALHAAGFKIETEKVYWVVLEADDRQPAVSSKGNGRFFRRKHQMLFRDAVVRANGKTQLAYTKMRSGSSEARVTAAILSKTANSAIHRTFLSTSISKETGIAYASVASVVSKLLKDGLLDYTTPTQGKNS